MSDFTPYKIYGIVGHPLGHSMSPMLHTIAFRTLGIPAVMVPWSLEPEKFPAFVEAFRILDIQGASVTIPYKQTVIPYLDEVSDRVKTMDAANLIYRKDGKICGDNTDVIGFMAPLETARPDPGSRVLLMGAGGAARAVVAGLQMLGLRDITVADVVPDLAGPLVKSFGIKEAPWDARREVDADIIVNATPLGMKGKFFEQTAYPAEWLAGRKGLAYDVVYTPAETRFQREAREAGWSVISGRTMFMAQAEAVFRIWTGLSLPEEAKHAVAEELDKQ